MRERGVELRLVVADQAGQLAGEVRGVNEQRVNLGAAVLDDLQQQVAVIDERLDLAVARREHPGHVVGARQQLLQLGVARGDRAREPGQAGQRGADLRRRVVERVGDRVERTREQAGVDHVLRTRLLRADQLGELAERGGHVERCRRPRQRNAGVGRELAGALRVDCEVLRTEQRLDPDGRQRLAPEMDALDLELAFDHLDVGFVRLHQVCRQPHGLLLYALRGLDHLGLIALLFVLAAACWWWTVNEMQGMDGGPWTDLGKLAWFVGVWVVMMAAMMFPSVAPTVALYSSMTKSRSPVAPLARVQVARTVGLPRLSRISRPRMDWMKWSPQDVLVMVACPLEWSRLLEVTV